MIKLHLDTDLGSDIDDVCALAMLLKWEDLEITGITTVAEEDGKRAGYTRHVLKIAGRSDIPVVAGADVSGGFYRFKPGYPDEQVYWSELIPPSPNSLDVALELLKSSIEQNATIVAIGPLTNLALLDQKYPGILHHANIHLMGGYLSPPRKGFPQWENTMDYNIQLDIASAKYVLEHANPTLIPLTVTVETSLRRAYIPELQSAGALGNLIARQAEAQGTSEQNEKKWGETCANLPNDILNFQHDPLACAVALGWNGVKKTILPLTFDIQDGWLHERVKTEGKPTTVVVEVDGNAFNTFWLKVVTR